MGSTITTDRQKRTTMRPPTRSLLVCFLLASTCLFLCVGLTSGPTRSADCCTYDNNLLDVQWYKSGGDVQTSRRMRECPVDTDALFNFDVSTRKVAFSPSCTKSYVDFLSKGQVNAYCKTESWGWVSRRFYDLPVVKNLAVTNQSLNVDVMLYVVDAISRAHFIESTPSLQEWFEVLRKGNDVEIFDFRKFHVTGWHTVAIQPIMMIGYDCTGKSVSPQLQKTPQDMKAFIPYLFQTKGFESAYFSEMCLDDLQWKIHPFTQIACPQLLKTLFPNVEELRITTNPPNFNCRGSLLSHPEHDSLSCKHKLRDLHNLIIEHQAKTKKFRFTFAHAMQAHYSVNPRRARDTIDGPLRELFGKLDLANQITFLVGDHGLHFGDQLANGSTSDTAHKFPPFFLIIPKKLCRKYPDLSATLQKNQGVLLSAWDIHASLRHVLSYPAPFDGSHNTIGKSVFEAIPKSRTCSEAGVPLRMCGCLCWKETEPRKYEVGIARWLEEEVNARLRGLPDSPCPLVHLKQIGRAREVHSEGITFARVWFSIGPGPVEMLAHAKVVNEIFVVEEVIRLTALHSVEEELATVLRVRNITMPDINPMFCLQRGWAFWQIPRRFNPDSAVEILISSCGMLANPSWVAAVLNPTICPNQKSPLTFDKNELVESASCQCGAWCVFDIRKKGFHGWQFNGKCWAFALDVNCKATHKL